MFLSRWLAFQRPRSNLLLLRQRLRATCPCRLQMKLICLLQRPKMLGKFHFILSCSIGRLKFSFWVFRILLKTMQIRLKSINKTYNDTKTHRNRRNIEQFCIYNYYFELIIMTSSILFISRSPSYRGRWESEKYTATNFKELQKVIHLHAQRHLIQFVTLLKWFYEVE